MAVLRAKRALRLKSRIKPREILPFIKANNQECVSSEDFEQIYQGIRDWNQSIEEQRESISSSQAFNLLREMNQGNLQPRLESTRLAIESIALKKPEELQQALSLVSADYATDSIVSSAKTLQLQQYLSKEETLAKVEKLSERNPIAMKIYEDLLTGEESLNRAERIFDSICKKGLPSKNLANHMIEIYARHDLVEKAFKLMIDLQRKLFQPNASSLKALLFAARGRKEFFPDLIDLVRQCQVKKYALDLRDLNSIIFGAGRLGNLDTVLKTWTSITEFGHTPNLESFTALFWSLAATETNETKLSVKRQFTIDASAEEIIHTAKDAMLQCQELGLKPDKAMLTAYLAVFVNSIDRFESEHVFYKLIREKQPKHFLMMLRMYDSIRCYEGMQKISDYMDKLKIAKDYPMLRHMIRTCALTDRLEEAAAIIRQHKLVDIPFKDLKEYYHRAYLQGRLDIIQFITDHAKSDIGGNPHLPIRERSIRVGKLLEAGYGPKGPKIATYEAQRPKDKDPNNINPSI